MNTCEGEIILSKKECKDHLGNIYSSIADMCRFYKLTPDAYKQRIKSGWSVERALTESTDRYSCKDYLGNTFSSEVKMCEHYGIDYRTYWARVHNMGWSIERALTEPRRDDSVYDFNNKAFKNISEMCAYYNIPIACFRKRIQNNWSLKDALSIPSGSKNDSIQHKGASKECYDHLGNKYSSKKEMAEAYNLSFTVFLARLNRGWTLKDALEKPLGYTYQIKKEKNRKLINDVPCVDFLGNEFLTIREMCAYYNISCELYNKRLWAGWTQKEALTIPKRKNRNKRLTSPNAKPCFDHKGILYNSYSEMANTYSINPGTLMKRLSEGWTIKDALERPIKNTVKDHLGNEFDCLADMLRYYHLSNSVFFVRYKKLKWTLEESLTTPIGKTSKTHIECRDILGNTFSTMKDMCKYWNVSYDLYCNRLYSGWTSEEALFIPKNMYIGEYRVAECLKKLNVKFYHDCQIKTIFKDLNISIDWDIFLDSLQHNLSIAGMNWSKKKIEKLRPDFVLYTDENNKIRGVIEFDGEQHQNFVEFFFKTIEEFYRRSNVDFVKQSLWEYLNIPMLRIRHDQIDMIDDMVKDFIDNPQNYIHNHNTYLSEDEYWSILSEEKAKLELAFAS